MRVGLATCPYGPISAVVSVNGGQFHPLGIDPIMYLAHCPNRLLSVCGGEFVVAYGGMGGTLEKILTECFVVEKVAKVLLGGFLR